MRPTFICHKCKKTITRKQDLVTTMFYIRIYLFHNTCFNQQVFFSSFIPINTLFGAYFIWYTLAIGSILTISDPSVIWIFFLVPTLYHFISYYYIERHFR
ncbi:permease [Bacillus sp. TL12]|uniref:permease n=1 Tax=Bacillus sp. TL12 TaxID=2894756 RepID=UPI001F527F9A|nr:permease [Bacillus sp. TL12]MCI0764302.1 permease [Bacillus sp. TL12]